VFILSRRLRQRQSHPKSTNMISVLIIRTPNQFNNPGQLYLFNENGLQFKCKTLELPYLSNQQKVSCIPTGLYDCKSSYSPRFKKILPEVLQVPNRSGIRIHSGNYASFKKTDSQGCILLGSALIDINGDGILDVTNSLRVLKEFQSFIKKSLFELIID